MRACNSIPRRPPLALCASEAPARVIDPLELAHLRADQFHHLTTLGVAGAGGLLVLPQVEMSGTRATIDRCGEDGYVC